MVKMDLMVHVVRKESPDVKVVKVGLIYMYINVAIIFFSKKKCVTNVLKIGNNYVSDGN